MKRGEKMKQKCTKKGRSCSQKRASRLRELVEPPFFNPYSIELGDDVGVDIMLTRAELALAKATEWKSRIR